MKQNFGFMLLLSVASMYAASTGEQSATVTAIAENPAAVLNNMIGIGVSRSSAEALASDMGKVYVGINSSPSKINSLWDDPAVVEQAERYNGLIVATKTMQRLTAVVSTLVKDNASQLKRAEALGALGVKYSLKQEKITKEVIRGITFPLIGTVENTLKSNMRLVLSAKEQLSFKAAQLSMALNMNTQYALDSSTFDAMWHEYLPTDGSDTSVDAQAAYKGKGSGVATDTVGCILI